MAPFSPSTRIKIHFKKLINFGRGSAAWLVDLFPDQGFNLGPQQLKPGILTARLNLITPKGPPQNKDSLKKKFTYLFLSLTVTAMAFSSCGKQGLLFCYGGGLLFAVTSLATQHSLYRAHGLQQLWLTGLVASGIFPEQELNPLS